MHTQPGTCSESAACSVLTRLGPPTHRPAHCRTGLPTQLLPPDPPPPHSLTTVDPPHTAKQLLIPTTPHTHLTRRRRATSWWSSTATTSLAERALSSRWTRSCRCAHCWSGLFVPLAGVAGKQPPCRGLHPADAEECHAGSEQMMQDPLRQSAVQTLACTRLPPPAVAVCVLQLIIYLSICCAAGEDEGAASRRLPPAAARQAQRRDRGRA